MRSSFSAWQAFQHRDEFPGSAAFRELDQRGDHAVGDEAEEDVAVELREVRHQRREAPSPDISTLQSAEHRTATP